MHKGLAIAGLFVMLGTAAGQNSLPNPPRAGITKHEPGKEGQKQPKAQSNNQPTPSTVSAAQQPTCPTCNRSSENGSQESQVNLWLMRFTGALVGVGLLQVIAI